MDKTAVIFFKAIGKSDLAAHALSLGDCQVVIPLSTTRTDRSMEKLTAAVRHSLLEG